MAPDKTSAPGQTNANLVELRKRIDALDKQLLELLNQRAGCSLEVGAIKAMSGGAILHPGRERELLDHLMSQNKGPLPNTHLRAIYREILSSSRALQKELRVGYVGPEGNFSHMAGIEYLGSSLDFMPFSSLEELFSAVANKACELGIVLLESSRQGSLAETIDLFATNKVSIQAEWFSRNMLSLFSREDSMASIHTVYAPPHLLAQCAGWLKRSLPKAKQIPVESTLAGAHAVREEAGSAAIGHNNLALRLGLHVLATQIEDYASTWTRFCLIGQQGTQTDPKADKSSVLFSLPDAPGSLGTVLKCFSDAGVNLSKLESRFIAQDHNTYMFFADIACNLHGQDCPNLLENIRNCCQTLHILGTYPSGIIPQGGAE